MSALQKFPLFILLMMIAAIAMLVPAAHAATQGNWYIARVFFQYSILVFAFSALVGTAMMARKDRNIARKNLMTLILAFSLLPVFLALPFAEVLPYLSFQRAYFEMLSSFTTTGATLFEDPYRLSESLHLWRALVGWLGGMFILVAALAILDPLRLGGFEVRQTMSEARVFRQDSSNNIRFLRAMRQVIPAYTVFTLILALLLTWSGDRIFVATLHAMSTLSTSAISPIAGLGRSQAGFAGELFIALFLVFAISSKLMTFKFFSALKTMPKDPEFQLFAGVIMLTTAFMFVRHWLAALEGAAGQDFSAGLSALWGAFFTTLSYLTTTGFESSHWQAAQSWSGLQAPGIFLFGLAAMGGGVATTAGGVKLLRIYALYRHGVREMDRLVYPGSVGRSGISSRQFRHQGAKLAWVFLMLFLLSVAGVSLVLSYLDMSFNAAMALAFASLTNTGPLYMALGDTSAHYGTLPDSVLGIISAAMILGRVETLALIALLNPNYWRH